MARQNRQQSIFESSEMEDELLSIIKIDGKGFNLALFEDADKMSQNICEHCKGVCCDPMELGCDHDDDDIFLYCNLCLTQLIEDKDGNCPIDNHTNPIPK